MFIQTLSCLLHNFPTVALKHLYALTIKGITLKVSKSLQTFDNLKKMFRTLNTSVTFTDQTNSLILTQMCSLLCTVRWIMGSFSLGFSLDVVVVYTVGRVLLLKIMYIWHSGVISIGNTFHDINIIVDL